MVLKRALYSALFILVSAVVACKTTTPAVPDTTDPVDVVSSSTESTETDTQTQNTQTVPQFATEQEKNEALFDIRDFILKLNKIVQKKDYAAWYSYLTQDYIAYYSNPDVLAEISNQPTLRKFNIVLKSLQDYFNYVVYPSRQNDAVDEIEYIGYNKVKVYTYVNNVRLVLYVLEKVDGKWMISR
jgi:hypothetical protein